MWNGFLIYSKVKYCKNKSWCTKKSWWGNGAGVATTITRFLNSTQFRRKLFFLPTRGMKVLFLHCSCHMFLYILAGMKCVVFWESIQQFWIAIIGNSRESIIRIDPNRLVHSSHWQSFLIFPIVAIKLIVRQPFKISSYISK